MGNINEKLLNGRNNFKMDLYSQIILFLFIASRNGHFEIVKELLNRNANIEAKDKDGHTPLICGIFLNELFIFNSFI